MPAPVITTIAGNGVYGYSGDGGPATSAMLYMPYATAVDSNGNVFVADTYNSRIREIVNATGNIITVAGSGSASFYGDGGQAIYAGIARPNGVAVDSSGNLYIADTWNNRIREVVKATGNIITIAGNGSIGYSGDGGPATSAMINYAFGIAVDSSGNVFFADQGNNRIREIVKATGTIITVAGAGGTGGYNGDNIPATSAYLNQPNGLAVDGAGNIYISDWHNNRIREVVKATGQIITIAGTGSSGFTGDGGPATAARVNFPGGVAVDASGNVFIADSSNERIREVVKATGIITTIAGNGTLGYSGDGGPPTSAAMNLPYGITVDNSGNVYFADSNNHRLREVINSMGLGGLSTSAWTVNQPGYVSGITITGGAAPFSNLSATGLPPGVTAALSNNTIVLSGTPTTVGTYSNAIISVQDAGGNIASRTYSITINAVPALGSLSPNTWTAQVQGFTGSLPISGGTGTVTLIAQANVPPGMTPVLSGTTIYLQGIPSTQGTYSNIQLTVRDAAGATSTGIVSMTVNAPALGSILTVAGTNYSGYYGDGGPANQARLYNPYSVAVDSSGNIFIADYQNSRIREVVKATGNIITIAGTGTNGFSGDGGPATSAKVYFPTGVAVDASGNVFIADSYNQRIREIVKATGIIITVAGNGATTDSGDGGPATAAGIASPQSVAVDASGNLYIGDTSTHRIRKVVQATGTIITIAGTGTAGFSGDNGPATAAMLNNPYGVAVDGSGNVYIADSNNNRVREVVQATGNIITIAGTGTAGYSGNYGPATSAKLYNPKGVAVDAYGDVFIADTYNSSIREVQRYNGDNIITVAGMGTSGYSGDGGPATSGKLYWPYAVSLDGSGNLYIADMLNNVVREVLLYPPLVMGPLSPTQWTVNQSGYFGSIAIINGPVPAGTFLDASGMPPGLTASPNVNAAGNYNNITITGTPTAVGTYTATLTIRGASGAPYSSHTYSFTINAAPTLGSLSSSQWTVGQTGFPGTIAATGGTGALTISSQTNLPPGLSATISGSVVTFTGTPSVTGTFSNIQVTILDAIGVTYTGTYSVTINPAPTLGTLSNNIWTINQTGFTGTVSISGGTAPFGSLTATGLPPGLAAALSGNTITISGTPTTAGVYNNIQLSVQDGAGAATGGTYSITITGPAVAFSLTSYPTAMTAGASGSFTLAALDSSGYVVVGYRGTVTLGSSDPITGSPTTYTFTAADNGVHTFAFTLDTAGSQQLYASDSTAGISGFSGPITVTPAALDHFVVAAPQTSASYYSFNLTVSAKDAYGNTITDYTGTVQFTSSDSAATLPADYTFTADDQGTHAFTVALQTAGNQTVTVADAGAGANGTATILDIDYVPGLHFLFDTPSTTTAGAPFDVTVIALDENNDVATHYDGTIAWSGNDLGASVELPADYTFTAADGGVHTFIGDVTLVTAGTRFLEAVDTSGYGDTTSADITVVPAATSSFTLSGFPTTVVAGATQSFTVTGVDAYGNVVTSYDGTIHFSSTDGQVDLPADAALSNGIGSFSVVLKTAGTQSITAEDATNPALTVTKDVTVTPASAAHLVVAGFPTTTTAGVTGTFTVTALDAYGNTATDFAGTVHFSSSDPQAAIPADYTFSAADHGLHTFAATLRTAGSQSLTVADTVGDVTGGSAGDISVSAADAVALASSAPTMATAGSAFSFTVQALDAFGNQATGYTGTVHFASSDPRADLPADYAFTAADGGSHVFVATLTSSGSQTLTASDAGSGVTANHMNIDVAAGATSAFTLGGLPDSVTAGVATAFTVVAIDAYGNITPGYTGTVQFSSTDSQAALPADYTFSAADTGTHTFSAALKTAGSRSLLAQDTAQSIISAIHWSTVTAAAASSFAASYPAATTAGAAENLTIYAYDAYGNVATGYTGTVHVTSSDGQATFPADYTFTGADAGVHYLSTTLKTAGTQAITVSDAQNGFTRTVSGINVSAAAASRFTIGGFPASTTAGTPGSLIITAYDAYNNIAKGYVGTVHFTSNDTQAGLPADYTFTSSDQGARTFSATLKTAGVRSLTATDTVNSSLAATQAGITVVAAAVSKFTVSGYPVTVAGVSHSFTVIATDAYGNLVTGYRGTVHFTSSDAQAGLPANYTFTAGDNGVHTFSATLKTAGSQSLTATDTATSSITATQSGITVTAAAATHLAISAPANVSNGVAFSVTVTALDAFGNIATGNLGTIHFTSSDHKAILPSNYTFTAGDAGVHTFQVTLKSNGTQTITATDTQTGSIKGSASVRVS